mmetsp:Transcript_47259/g.93254  ORF Transcript_47259/g.93254 Transcript_47259/m.93254 type:complete len:212 (+) Transcript_47259:92-727(+)
MFSVCSAASGGTARLPHSIEPCVSLSVPMFPPSAFPQPILFITLHLFQQTSIRRPRIPKRTAKCSISGRMQTPSKEGHSPPAHAPNKRLSELLSCLSLLLIQAKPAGRGIDRSRHSPAHAEETPNLKAPSPLSVCVSVYMPLCANLCVHPISLSACLSIYLFISLPACLPVYSCGHASSGPLLSLPSLPRKSNHSDRQTRECCLSVCRAKH